MKDLYLSCPYDGFESIKISLFSWDLTLVKVQIARHFYKGISRNKVVVLEGTTSLYNYLAGLAVLIFYLTTLTLTRALKNNLVITLPFALGFKDL